MSEGLKELKEQIKKIIYDFTISPFTQHIAIRELEKNLLGLLDGYDIYPKGTHVCIPKKQLEDKIIRLAQLRAGNIDVIWDAGHAYGLLSLFGKAPRFKTRDQYYEWAEKNICRFHSEEEARAFLEKE